MNITIPYDAPLNMCQKSIIVKPYREGGKIEKTVGYLKANPDVAFNALLPFNQMQFNIVDQYQGNAAAYTVLAAVTIPFSIGCQIAGLVIFESLVLMKSCHNIYRSTSYLTWQSQHAKLVESESIIEFIQMDDILGHLICPITNKIPNLPAKTEDNLTYDFEAALDWFNKNPGKPLPGSSCMNANELTFDYAHINSVITRLHELPRVLKSEEKQKICLVLNIKEANQPLIVQAIEVFVQYCLTHNLGTVAKLFSGRNRVVKKSFEHLNRILSITLTCSKNQREERIQSFASQLSEITNLPQTTFHEQKKHEERLIALYQKSCLIKRISFCQMSPLTRIQNFVFPKKQLPIITREECEDIREWSESAIKG